MILSGGDVELNGSSSLLNPDLYGTIYARSQCKLPGKLVIDGQLICKDLPNQSGTLDLATSNEISGETQISFGCGGYFGKRGRIVDWYQTIGT